MKRLIIMGAGTWGCYVLKKNRFLYDDIKFFDNDANKVGNYIEDCEVISCKKMLKLVHSEIDDIDIIIAANDCYGLLKQAIDLGMGDKIVAVINSKAHSCCQDWYSQDGEDMFLTAYFQDKDKGFYVDIGAHDPYRFSNTAWAYEKGWHGINVEPNPKQIDEFNNIRQRDINLQIGCAGKSGVLKYYCYKEPALNSFDKTAYPDLEPIDIINVPVKTLNQILKENNVEKIDLLSIDTEGLEKEILYSNDWKQWSPTLVVVESFEHTIESLIESDIYKFMKKQEYNLLFRTLRNSIYEKQ